MRSTVGPIREVPATEIALVRSNASVQNEMRLQSFASFERGVADIALVLPFVGMDQLVFVECSAGLELHTTDTALVNVGAMNVGMDLEQMIYYQMNSY